MSDIFESFFQWLGHPIVEIRVVDPTQGRVLYQNLNITSPEEFAHACAKYNGKGQVYFSIHGRDGKGGRYENVPYIDFFPIDIDAKRPDKQVKPVNDKQRGNAFRNAERILEYLKGEDIRSSLMVDTGNGVLILIKIPRIETHAHFYKVGDQTFNKLSDKMNGFYRELRNLCDETVEIDSVSDLPRCLGVPGTVNVKGGRERMIVGSPAVLNTPPKPQPHMWELIERFERCWQPPPSKPALADVDRILSLLPESLRQEFTEPEKVEDRSLTLIKALRYLANELCYSRDECVAAMNLLTKKIGRVHWPAAQQYEKDLAEGKIEAPVKLGDYTLQLWGDTVLILDKDGKAQYHLKFNSLSSLSHRRALAKSVGVKRREVDRAAARLTQHRVKAEEKRRTTTVAEKKTSPEIVEKALEILRDPDLLCRMAEVLHGPVGLVGETKNALLTFLTELSSKLTRPVNQRYSGRASIGKSTIVTKVAQLWPPEDLIIRGGLTKKALYYLPEAEDVDENTKRLMLGGKVLIVLEESESQEFLNEVKPLLSHDVPVLKYSFVEEKVTRTVLLEGWPAYIGITTVPIKGEEHETRTLLTSPDRGSQKYGAVIYDDAERGALPWEYNEVNLEVWREAVRQLKPLKVWIPWLSIVAQEFPHHRAGSMRDWKKFRTYIEAMALLHQHQREHVAINGAEYVVATPFDLDVASRIVAGAMAETMMGLERDTRELWETMCEEDPEKAKAWTYKDIMNLYERHFGEPVSRTTLRDRYTDKLVDLGLLELDDSQKTYRFSVSTKNPADLADSNNIVSAVLSEENKAKIKEKMLLRQGGVRGVDFHDIVEKLEKSYAYTLSGRNSIKNLLERSKDKEYPKESFLSETAKSAGLSLAEKKPKPARTLLTFEQILSGPHGLTGEMWHKGRCAICGYERTIEWHVTDFKRERQEICSDCAWRYSAYLWNKGEGSSPDADKVDSNLVKTLLTPEKGDLSDREKEETPKGHIPIDEKTASKLAERLRRLRGEKNEWEGFVAIGPRATPEKNYEKTVQALHQFTRLENRNAISDGELEQALGYYWNKECWHLVIDRLVKDQKLKRFDGKFLILEEGNRKISGNRGA